jgi:succinate-semialdehyde dehydrogenase / glutarate-semialdehyde dehydrogenase
MRSLTFMSLTFKISTSLATFARKRQPTELQGALNFALGSWHCRGLSIDAGDAPFSEHLANHVGDVGLIRTQAYIGGQWKDAADGATFDVHNPATGEIIARVANCRSIETGAAITTAATAFQSWSGRNAKDRAAVLRAWHSLILENREGLARMMTLECGKVLAEAKQEVDSGCATGREVFVLSSLCLCLLRILLLLLPHLLLLSTPCSAESVLWFAEECRRGRGEVLQPPDRRRFLVLSQPMGVAAAITPWNFPFSMVTRKVAPALAAGCTVILKPAALTPLTALALAQLAERAGLPRGALSVVPGADAAAIAGELMRSEDVRKLSFTGSTAVGKMLYSQAASTVKRLSLELGGNAPFVVFRDADIELAARHAAMSSYRNSGQTCICTKRVLVEVGWLFVGIEGRHAGP